MKDAKLMISLELEPTVQEEDAENETVVVISRYAGRVFYDPNYGTKRPGTRRLSTIYGLPLQPLCHGSWLLGHPPVSFSIDRVIEISGSHHSSFEFAGANVLLIDTTIDF